MLKWVKIFTLALPQPNSQPDRKMTIFKTPLGEEISQKTKQLFCIKTRKEEEDFQYWLAEEMVNMLASAGEISIGAALT